MKSMLCVTGVLMILVRALIAAEPALPTGLDVPASAEPALPIGLDVSPVKPLFAASSEQRWPPEGVSDFWELRGGARLQDDPYEKAAALGETRLQLQLDRAIPISSVVMMNT